MRLSYFEKYWSLDILSVFSPLWLAIVELKAENRGLSAKHLISRNTRMRENLNYVVREVDN
jgi:hypothetical protein